MTCRDCIHHGACADIVEKFLEERHPDWEDEWYFSCGEFDTVPANKFEASTNVSKAPATVERIMDEVGAQLINLYAEYSRMAGYPDDDYAKAVCIAVRMLSD